jgi:hypothetical protein
MRSRHGLTNGAYAVQAGHKNLIWYGLQYEVYYRF